MVIYSKLRLLGVYCDYLDLYTVVNNYCPDYYYMYQHCYSLIDYSNKYCNLCIVDNFRNSALFGCCSFAFDCARKVVSHIDKNVESLKYPNFRTTHIVRYQSILN